MVKEAARIRLDPLRLQAMEEAASALAKFKRAFGRDLKPEFLAELYVARELGLEIVLGVNETGYDAVAPNGDRYQIKLRNAPNVDFRNFDFDVLVLVNLDEDYQPVAMWRVSVEKVKQLCVYREKHQKYQVTQTHVVKMSERIR